MNRRVIVLDLDGVLFSNPLIQCLVCLCRWLPKGKRVLYLKAGLIGVVEFLERIVAIKHRPNAELIRSLSRRGPEDILVICTDRSLKGLEYVWGIVSSLNLRPGDAVQFRDKLDRSRVARDKLPVNNGVAIFVTNKAKPDGEVLRIISQFAESIPVTSRNVVVVDDDRAFLESARKEHQFRTVLVQASRSCVMDLRTT